MILPCVLTLRTLGRDDDGREQDRIYLLVVASTDFRRYSAYKVPITEFTDRVIYRLLNFRS